MTKVIEAVTFSVLTLAAAIYAPAIIAMAIIVGAAVEPLFWVLYAFEGIMLWAMVALEANENEFYKKEIEEP